MDDREWEAFKTEYASLREESLHTSQIQQAVFQWSIGATAVLFAGVMALAGDPGIFSINLRILMLGFAIPGFVVSASLAWAGELVRKERIAFYLRSRERVIWSSGYESRKSLDAADLLNADELPLAWENFISFSRAGIGEKRASFGYVGGVAIYFGATLTSLILFAQTLLPHEFAAHDFAYTTGGLVYAAIVLVTYLAFLIYFGWSVLRRSRRVAVSPPHESQGPVD